MGDDPSDVSPLAGSAALRSLAVRWPRALSFNGITLWAPHSPPVLTVFAHRCRPPALPPPQVASRKVKQLIVLVDKMEQAQSALELKLRGTEVRPPALILLLLKKATIASFSSHCCLTRVGRPAQEKLKSEQATTMRLTEELAAANVRALSAWLSLTTFSLFCASADCAAGICASRRKRWTRSARSETYSGRI
jgi:hypothetical protein